MGKAEQHAADSTASDERSDDEETPESTQLLAVPDRLVNRVEQRLPRTDFEEPEAYVTYALEEVLSQVESEADDNYEQVDGDEVEERLQSLGYLD
jgi:hypothetical protein